MKTAYFDCFAGISGDMALGALIDLGVDPGTIDAAVRGLGLEGFRLEVRPVSKHGIGGTRVEVQLEAAQPERHLHQIEAMLGKGELDPAVRAKALAVFRRLGEAEARVHRVPIEHVHFHEVGALDAIVDVVGTCAGLRALGVERVVASPVVVGRGLARGEHGPLPVPGPATLELLRGVPVREGPVEAEMTTPTGAALVTTLAAAFGPLPDLRVIGAGYGAGTRDHPALPNLLRVVVGEESRTAGREEGTAVLLEANLDDLAPQVLAYVSGRLLEAGALDVWTAPVVMKKGRSGHVLSLLAPPERARQLGEILFAETTTLGIRSREVHRVMLARRIEEVETPNGRVRIKVAGEGASAQPEYDDCAAIAERTGVPLREVQAAALAAWQAGRRTGE